MNPNTLRNVYDDTNSTNFVSGIRFYPWHPPTFPFLLIYKTIGYTKVNTLMTFIADWRKHET